MRFSRAVLLVAVVGSLLLVTASATRSPRKQQKDAISLKKFPTPVWGKPITTDNATDNATVNATNGDGEIQDTPEPRKPSNFGKHFYVSASRSQLQLFTFFTHKIYIYAYSRDTEYSISHTAGTLPSQEGTVTTSNPAVYTIAYPESVDTAFVSSGEFSERMKGLYIKAGKDVSVLYTMGERSNWFSSYQAYPRKGIDDESDYEYYAVSMPTPEKQGHLGQVLLVANRDSTNIVITPAVQIELPDDAQQPNSQMIQVNADTESHEIVLQEGQTLLFTSKEDLTGSKIMANKPVTVISGHQCASPQYEFCEHLAVQVPPAVTWGYEFLLAPFAFRKTGQYYKVVRKDDSDTVLEVTSGGETAFTQFPKQHRSLVLTTNSGQYSYLKSTKPVMVVQMATGQRRRDGTPVDDLGDPIMTLVSPLHMYVSDTMFLGLDSSVFTKQAITVTVEAGDDFDPAAIVLDGAQLDCIWVKIENAQGTTVGHGCTFTGITGDSDGHPHSISHENNGRLSVLSYGFAIESGYGYLAGMYLTKPSTDAIPEPPPPGINNFIPFFDLTGVEGVLQLPHEQDATSEPIVIPKGVIAFDRRVSEIYVSENGVISFGESFQFSHPDKFPTNNAFIQDMDVLAPFWGDNDIRKEGEVRYVLISKDQSQEGDDIIDQIMDFLEKDDTVELEKDFLPKWTLVVQWEKVHPYPHGSNDHLGTSEAFLEQTNTYQTVLISDGFYSYYANSYTCGDIGWATIGEESAVVGTNLHKERFSNHPGSGFPNIDIQISCTSFSATASQLAPVTTGGQIEADEATQNAVRDCNLFETILSADFTPEALEDEILPNVRICPPTMNQADKDENFHTDPNNANCRLQAAPFVYRARYSIVQQCCYDASGALITNIEDGAGTLLPYDPTADNPDPNEYELFDVPYKEACCVNGGDCDQYLSTHPINDGTDYEPPEGSLAWGDPHYETFDFKKYDFMGRGDFVCMELLSSANGPVIFQIQSRLEETAPWFGATVHRALAIGNPNQGIGFEIYPENNQLFVHDTASDQAVDITNVYRPANGHVDYQFKRLSNVQIKALHSSGISMTITWNSNAYMNVNYQIPGVLRGRGRIRGLFGDYDGRNDNEFARRDNPTVPVTNANSNGQEQFNVQNTWAVQPGESMFRNGLENVATTEGFTPVYFEDLEFTDEQRTLCKNKRACLYDLHITKDVEVAINTLNDEEDLEETRLILKNFPPVITGKSVIQVTVGIETTYTFHVNDKGDDFTVLVEGGLPDGATLSNNGNGDYTLRWTPAKAIRYPLGFLARDHRGAARRWKPQVRVCACVNGGLCVLNGIFDLLVASSVVMRCICPEAYSGRFCEEDTNGCSKIECFKGVECVDLPAPEKGARCGPCPSGYNGNGEKCIDIDECAENPSPCDQVCENTVGGFECKCNPGYKYKGPDDGCQDINECAGPNECQQICTNNVGSFTCSCREGFVLSNDGRSCEAATTCTGNKGCEHGCALKGGKEECFCPTGTVVSPKDETRCNDVDECKESSPCDQICTNTIGSYECSCEDGYEFGEDSTCQDIDECLVAGLEGRDPCPNGIKECTNIPGTFECVCPPGFIPKAGGCAIEEIQVLDITFVENSPIVNGNDISIFVEVDKPVNTLECRIDSERYQDCKTGDNTGMYVFSDLADFADLNGHIIRVRGTIEEGEVELQRRADIAVPGQCTVHFINDAVTVGAGAATIHFSMTSDTTSVVCELKLESTDIYEAPCASQDILILPGPGSYELKLVPQGCESLMTYSKSHMFTAP